MTALLLVITAVLFPHISVAVTYCIAVGPALYEILYVPHESYRVQYNIVCFEKRNSDE